MFFLKTQSPLAAAPRGFPRREGAAYLPGDALREALLTAALETWLAGAARSYAEALAGAEMAAILPVRPEAEPFYQKLKERALKSEAWPLRVGYWTPEPAGGRFLAFERLPEAAQALARRFESRSLPGRCFYYPKGRRTLGWILLGRED